MLSKKQKALLHVAKVRLGLSDAEYRAMLGSFGVRSAKDKHFTQTKFDKLMRHLKTLGFVTTQEPIKSKQRLLNRIDDQLESLGLKRGYADAICRHIFGIDLCAWCDADQLHRIAAALNYHTMRNRQKDQLEHLNG